MKKWMSLVVLLTVLLCGCGNADTSGTEATPPTQEPLPSVPVTAYDLPVKEYEGLRAMGDDLLLWSDNTLTRLDGRSLKLLDTATSKNWKLSDETILQADGDGVVLYEPGRRTVSFLDSSLELVSYIQLKEVPMGQLLISSNREKLYYCTSEGVRVLDVATGFCRTLCQKPGKWLGVTASLLDDSMLHCVYQENDGDIRTLVISAITGKTLRELKDIELTAAAGQMYFATLQTDAGTQWVYGWGKDQARNFQVESDALVYPLPENGAAITARDTQDGVVLDYFNLKTGKRVSSLEQFGITEVADVICLENRVLFRAGGKLCCWMPELTAVEDEKSYTSFRYTREDPNEAGLQLCLDQARELEEFYGIDIHLWEDVTGVQPNGYTFEVEYIPENYTQTMTELEKVLSIFGGGFFRKVAERTDSGRIHIVLVRSILTDAKDTHPNTAGMHYMLDGNIYMVLELGKEVERSFCHMLGHIVDSKVLSNSNKVYEWHKYNPENFEYDGNYSDYKSRTDTKYLKGSKRYFINAFSMSFPAEDRATIFEYAVTSGNEEYFESKYMRVKLRRICKGIREAFGLKGEEYPWEQYLN